MDVLLDTSIVIDILRGDKRGVDLMERLEAEGATFHLPSPALYELAVGFAHLGARHQQRLFESMAAYWHEAPFTDREARAAGEVQADLLSTGDPASDVDVQIAGTAVSGRMVLASTDNAHADVADRTGIGLRRPEPTGRTKRRRRPL